MEFATASTSGAHVHEIILTEDQVNSAKGTANKVLTGIDTTESTGHKHTTDVKWNKKKKQWIIAKCNTKSAKKGFQCKDQHGMKLNVVKNA